jgi:dynein heavy chain
LKRAEKLLGGLSGEAIRWKESEIKLGIDLVNLTGNILISSACISYLGPFTYAYRQELIEEWINECKL